MRELIPLLFGLAVVLAIIGLYDKARATLFDRYEKRIAWIEEILGRLFFPQGKRLVYWLSFGPAGTGIMLGLVFGIVGLGSLLIAFVLSVALGALGWFLPVLILKFLYKLRLKKFDVQLTDALNLLGSSLKAGLSFLQGLQMMVDELPNPLAQEFKLMLAEHRLGATIEEALAAMAKRLPSRDLDIIVNSIIILRETGGDLTETFDTLYTTIIGRRKVEGKIAAMTSMGMAQGMTLAAFPFAMGFAMYQMDPVAMGKMFTTPIGLGLVALGLLLETLGIFAMIRVTKIDV